MNQVMNQALPASLSNIWQSPNFPMWLTIVAAALFALILLITLFRAEKSVANGALTVITLLAVGIAATAMMRTSSLRQSAQSEGWPVPSAPSLACLDDLAGDNVTSACEKAVFASPENTAAAVSYTAAQITKLASYGNATAADEAMTPELRALRRAVERDRFGMVAYVLGTRDACTAAECAFFQSLTNTSQITSNMGGHVYDGLIARYLPSWNVPMTASAALPLASPAVAEAPIGSIAGSAPNAPTGKPLSGDFPSSASIPPISIMSAEPPASAVPQPKGPDNGAAPKAVAAPKAAAVLSAKPSPAPKAATTAANTPPAAKKPPKPHTAAPGPSQPQAIVPPPAAVSAPPAAAEDNQ